MKILFCIILCLSLTALSGQTVNDLRPTVTMKEYVDMQVDWQQKFNNAQLLSLKEASELVRLSLQEYKTVNNEWRGQIKDQTQTYVTRTELILAVTTLLGIFWNYSKYIREKQSSEGRNIKSGDTVEVKK